MIHKLNYYLGLAKALNDRDSGLRAQQAELDDMVHFNLDLPPALSDLAWIRKLIDATPYLAWTAGRRVLSGQAHHLIFEPYEDSEEARRFSSRVEKALKWNMDMAMRRRASSREDVVGNALLYDEIVGQVIHLPTQIKAIKSLGGNASRQEAALRDGPFAVVLRNPQQVHVTYSDYMAEQVLTVACMTKKEIIDFWGDAAKEVYDSTGDDEADLYSTCVLYDYIDYDARVVWVMETDAEGTDKISSPDYTIMKPTKNDYPFLPWATVVGGTATDDNPEYQRHSLLYPLLAGDYWKTTSLLGTFVVSQAIAEMGRAKRKKVGPTPDSIRTEFAEPGIEALVKIPNDLVDLMDHPLDPGLKEAWDRFQGMSRAASVPDILMNAQATPGESYSGFNLRMQSAVGQLLPFKRLSERWWEKAYGLMLLWSHYTGTNLKGYGTGKNGIREPIDIDSEDIDPNNIQLTVELIQGKATDRLQTINGAVLLAKQANVPLRQVYEELEYEDPEAIREQYIHEQFDMAELTGLIQKIQMEKSGALDQMVTQRAQQLIQQVQQQQMQQQQAQQQPMSPQQAGAMGAPPATGTPGMAGAEGQGMNPAMAGTPPAQMNPAANTRENQTGQSRGGGGAGMPG